VLLLRRLAPASQGEWRPPCSDTLADCERPVVPVRVNSRRALLSILPLSVMEIKRGVRGRQGDFEVNGGRQPALFTHCAPGADQSRVEENILAPDRHREWP
jgi:hypothetical protein